jgi:predicted RNA binding protein YcfA (HicA-like mRNA interferase family)
VSKLSPVSWKELVRKLRELGFSGPFSGGKHPFMIKGDLILTVPNPHRGDIGIDLLVRILRQAKINREDWLKT